MANKGDIDGEGDWDVVWDGERDGGGWRVRWK